MKHAKSFLSIDSSWLYAIVTALFLLVFSANSIAQPGSTPNQNSDQPSQSEQSSSYLQNIEKDPNGVPNTSAWYAQPWIWAIVAAVLVLVVGLIYKNYGKRDSGSERGLHS